MAPPHNATENAPNVTDPTGPAADLPEQAAQTARDVHDAIGDGLASAADTVGDIVSGAIPGLLDIATHLPAALVF